MLPWLDANLILLIVLMLLGLVSSNHTITFAVIFLLIVKFSPLKNILGWIETNGITWSVAFLTIAVLVPLVNGKVNAGHFFQNILDYKLIAAIVVGALVSWLGARGVNLMTTQPTLITGLLIGTVLGVALFKGVAVGPLIAAGMLSVVLFNAK